MIYCQEQFQRSSHHGLLDINQIIIPGWHHQINPASFIEEYYLNKFSPRQPVSHCRHPGNLEIRPRRSNISKGTMATPDVDEMEQFQQLSDQYQPNLPVSWHLKVLFRGRLTHMVQGPLIGHKKPLSDLVIEYSQADSTYVTKTRVCSLV
jgi:hypothetical protein